MTNEKTEQTEQKEECNDTASTAREEKISELDILRQSLEEKKKLADDYYDQLLRLKADFQNYRRRAEKEKQDHLTWGKEEILMKQVGLLDVMDQAARSSAGSSNIESILQGLELIRREFVKMLSSEGISEIEAKGKKFDPSLHEAIDQVESESEEGTILDVLQKGYTMNGRVIRPAKVRVAKKIEDKKEK